jgi:hypothetical protein
MIREIVNLFIVITSFKVRLKFKWTLRESLLAEGRLSDGETPKEIVPL